MTNQKRKRQVEINKLLSQQRHIYKKMNHLIFRKKPISESSTVAIGFKLLQCHMRLSSIKGSMYALISSRIPKHPKGGIVNRGFAIVGETGKELVLALGCSNDVGNIGSSSCYYGCDFGFDSHSALLKADQSANGTFKITLIAYHLHTHEPTKYHQVFNFENLPPLEQPFSLSNADMDLKARMEFSCKLPKH